MIRFVYFDLGNVLVNFSHQRMYEQLAAVLDVHPTQVQAVFADHALQNRYETGLLTTAGYCDELNRLLRVSGEHSKVVEAASDIFWLNEPVISWVRHLKDRQLPLGVLSNTCEAHWENVVNGPFQHVLPEFSEVILSFEIGAMKPDAKIYEVAIERAGVAAEEILFADDREENVEGARAAGLDAHLFAGVDSFVDVLRRRELI